MFHGIPAGVGGGKTSNSINICIYVLNLCRILLTVKDDKYFLKAVIVSHSRP